MPGAPTGLPPSGDSPVDVQQAAQSGSVEGVGGPDEAALVEGLRRGDPQSYERFVRDLTPRLLAVAKRYARTEEDAHDAVQDAFISAFKSINTFQAGAKISTWMHRIVVNAALMRVRSQKARPERSIEELLPTFGPNGHPAKPSEPWKRDTAAGIEREEVSAIVRRSMDQLPEAYRLVLVLRDVEEFSTEETAQFLQITPNAVKIRLHRARQALREALDPHMREGKVSP